MQLAPLAEQFVLLETHLPIACPVALRDRNWRSVEQAHRCVVARAVALVQLVKRMGEPRKEERRFKHVLLAEELLGHLAYVAQLTRHAQDLLLDVERCVELVEERQVAPR